MISYPEIQDTPFEGRNMGIARLITTAVVLSFGIAMAVAAVLVAAGVWLER